MIDIPINKYYQKNIFEVIFEVTDIYQNGVDKDIQTTITKLNEIITNPNHLETFSSNLKDIIESINFEEHIATIKNNLKVNNAHIALNILNKNLINTDDYAIIIENIKDSISGIEYNKGKWASSISSYKSNQYEMDIKEIREGLLSEDNVIKRYEENTDLDDELGKTRQADYFGKINEYINPFKSSAPGYHDLIKRGLPYILRLVTNLELNLNINYMLNRLKIQFEDEELLVDLLRRKIDENPLLSSEHDLEYKSKKTLEQEITENKKTEYIPLIVIHNHYEERIVSLIKYMLLELSFQISSNVIYNNFKLKLNQTLSAECVSIYWHEYGTPLPKKIINNKYEYTKNGPLHYLLCEFEGTLSNEDVLYTEIKTGIITNGVNNILKLITPNGHYNVLQKTLYELKLAKEETQKKEKKDFKQKIVNITTNPSLDNYIEILLHMPLSKYQKQIHKYVLGCCKQTIGKDFHAFSDVNAVDELKNLKDLIKHYTYSTTQKDLPKQNIIGYSIAKDNLILTQLIKNGNNYNESIIDNDKFTKLDDTYLFEIINKFKENNIYNEFITENYIKQITLENIIDKCMELSKTNIKNFCSRVVGKKNKKIFEEKFLMYNNLSRVINIVFGEIGNLSDNMKRALNTFREINNILRKNIILKTERALLTDYNLNKLLCSMVLVIYSEQDDENIVDDQIILNIYDKILLETKAYGLPTLLEYSNNITEIREDRKIKILNIYDKLSPDEINYIKLEKENFKDFSYMDFNSEELDEEDNEDNEDNEADEDNYDDGNHSDVD